MSTTQESVVLTDEQQARATALSIAKPMLTNSNIFAGASIPTVEVERYVMALIDLADYILDGRDGEDIDDEDGDGDADVVDIDPEDVDKGTPEADDQADDGNTLAPNDPRLMDAWA